MASSELFYMVPREKCDQANMHTLQEKNPTLNSQLNLSMKGENSRSIKKKEPKGENTSIPPMQNKTISTQTNQDDMK
jgi:hypothetical protein